MFDVLPTGALDARGAAAVDAWARVENAACARRLAAMVGMLDDAHAADGSADRDQWCLDNWAAVCAHIGAVGRVTSGAASGLLLVGVALRDRLPKVAAVFADGLIGFPLVRAIVQRCLLVTDPDALRALDATLASALRTWEPMSMDKTTQTIDAFVGQVDPYAVRRTQIGARSRSVDIAVTDGSGLADLFGTLFTPDATALDARLDGLADTTCCKDPRTRDQRRADALGALAHGADRLACLCQRPDCPAATNPPSSGVVVYVIAHHDTITDSTASDTLDPAGPGNAESPEGPNEPACEDPAEDCAGLDGQAPPMFATPLRELTLAQAMAPTPGRLASLRPAAMMGGGLLPGAVARRVAPGATLVGVVHPGQAPPEPRHTPSRRLADFIRCRDLTCRFPGCREPATTCDVDHTIAWPHGPTQASNLKALCRRHHLLKTFWAGQGGWRDCQLTDGTIIWTAPDGRTHTTTPGSRLLFPTMCAPTAPVIVTGEPPPVHIAGLTMPRRQRTRTQDRKRRIDDERELNRMAAALVESGHPAVGVGERAALDAGQGVAQRHRDLTGLAVGDGELAVTGLDE